MNEIISLHGKPFRQERRPRRRWHISFSAKRVAKALLVIFGTLALVGLACWLAYGVFCLEVRAHWGDAEAQYRLGKRGLSMAAAPQEQAKAIKFIRLAAEQGHAKAEAAMGYLYAKGIGLPQDSTRAATWLTKAAMQCDAPAQNELATMYASGKGIERDLRRAFHWFTQAAGNGSKLAKANLALLQAANSRSLGDLTTLSGDRYQKASLRRIEADGIMVAYDSGKGGVSLAKVKRDDLPKNLKQLCEYTATTNNLSNGGAPWF